MYGIVPNCVVKSVILVFKETPERTQCDYIRNNDFCGKNTWNIRRKRCQSEDYASA